jgi:Tol biopolymer transport system component
MSWFKAGCALLVLAGCGDVKEKSVDAAVHDSSQQIDAAVDADTRACDPAKPFGQPVSIMELDTASADAYIYLSSDELTAYVSTQGGPSPQGSYDLYVATRTSMTAMFGTLTPMSTLNSAASQEAPALTADGLTIYYYDGSTGGGDIFTAARSSVTANFGSGAAVAVINASNAYDHCPSISPDGLTLYFCSTRNNSSNLYDLFVTTRASTSSAFSAPTEITELNSTTFGEENEVVSADGLTIYYGSDMTGTAGLLDIWRASRASKNAPFGAPTNLSAINSAVDEWPSYVSADDCRLYFSSDRGGGQGSHDLYVAARPK